MKQFLEEKRESGLSTGHPRLKKHLDGRTFQDEPAIKPGIKTPERDGLRSGSRV
jgi:hypothetical protein